MCSLSFPQPSFDSDLEFHFECKLYCCVKIVHSALIHIHNYTQRHHAYYAALILVTFNILK